MGDVALRLASGDHLRVEQHANAAAKHVKQDGDPVASAIPLNEPGLALHHCERGGHAKPLGQVEQQVLDADRVPSVRSTG